MHNPSIITILLFLVTGSFAYAGEADVIDVEVRKRGSNLYDISVTVQHQDAGWDHYANRWEVLDEKGAVIGTRTLHHPHVNEQPFTRVLPGLTIPADIKKITIRSHDSVHEYGGKTITVGLPLQ
ncbi:MAG: hypothetical protein B6D79_04955 [gamma proteobacterium symbiont of Ctena orbiculata]|nr:MAG: hypothetical protein B6D79_04955 [gamma proteobacterium symbiont of Ctena orbiculata]